MLAHHSQLRESMNMSAVESLVQDAHTILKRLDYARSLAGRNSTGQCQLNIFMHMQPDTFLTLALDYPVQQTSYVVGLLEWLKPGIMRGAHSHSRAQHD